MIEININEIGYCNSCKSLRELEGDVKNDGCILKCIKCGSTDIKTTDSILERTINKEGMRDENNSSW